MINVTRAVQLGWVQDCSDCAEVRHLLEQLRRATKTDCFRNNTMRATNLEAVEVKCTYCDGRGWNLTSEGQMLVDLVQELYPDLCSRKPDANEVPF
jgi:hypothetical protein